MGQRVYARGAFTCSEICPSGFDSLAECPITTRASSFVSASSSAGSPAFGSSAADWVFFRRWGRASRTGGARPATGAGAALGGGRPGVDERAESKLAAKLSGVRSSVAAAAGAAAGGRRAGGGAARAGDAAARAGDAAALAGSAAAAAASGLLLRLGGLRRGGVTARDGAPGAPVAGGGARGGGARSASDGGFFGMLPTGCRRREVSASAWTRRLFRLQAFPTRRGVSCHVQ